MEQQLAYVIVGNGIAGVTAAEMLRAEDPSCSIIIVADDPFPAYYRPALKDFLGGRLPEEKLWARPATFYQQQRIRFIPGRVVGINTMQRFIQLQSGKHVNYSKLLLANGARPRSLSCPGLNLAGVSTLRTVADYQEILRRLSHVNRVVVSGSGTLALESAETLRHRDYQVTHLMRGHTLWSEVLDPIASDLVLQEERREGIDARTGEEIAEIVGKDGQVSGVITTHGEYISCEMVLIAVGIEPIIDFIRASGIACGRGVKVDNGMRTNIPDIYAAGDVIETADECSGRTRVLGQWFPAIQQAQVAAYNMLGLLTADHPFYPGSNSQLRKAYLNYYNATFLYGLDFVSIGLTARPSSPGYQEIVADPRPRSYRKAILKNGTIVGALLLGDRTHALAFKRAIDHRVHLAPIADRLFAADFDLDAWLDQQRIPGPMLNIKKQGVSEDNASGQNGVIDTLTGGDLHASVSRVIPESILRALNDTPALVLIARDAPPEVVRLTSGRPYMLGRDKHNDIIVSDVSSSRQHAEIFSAPDGFYVRDLNSRYGVFVNKVKINNAYHLSHADRIVLGNMLVYFSYPQGDAIKKQPVVNAPQHTPPSDIFKDEAAITSGNKRRATTALQRSTIEQEPVVVGLEHRREVQRLGEERVKFEIDMCIGCNRCMDACPVPISSQVTIADLNTATTFEKVTPHVARFTHECVMCGSCVPVCPVDNHRDLLMLSLKERLGVSWNSRPDIQRVADVLPAGWTIATLISRLREQAILRDSQQIPDSSKK